MSNLKLGVEVVSAHDLMPKDGQGSSNAFVELLFDGQKFRTTTKDKDLHPVWNESFYFDISDSNNLSNLSLEAHVYNDGKTTNSNSFLGKVRLTGKSFIPYSDALVSHYPLEKRSIFSPVKGELGLIVFVTDDPSIRSSNPLPAVELSMPTSTNSEARAQVPSSVPEPDSGLSSQAQAQVPNSVPDPYSELSAQSTDYALKETRPFLGGRKVIGGRFLRGDRQATTYDLVEQVQYLFIKVEKARDLPSNDVTGSLDPFVEVKVGNYNGVTKYYEKNQSPAWNEVFAFVQEMMQSSVLEVVVKDTNMVEDNFVGLVRFDLNEVPRRVPPDSQLAPEWYCLEDGKGEKKNGELMLAVWYGTQADEAFPEAWHSDAAIPTDRSSNVSKRFRSKVYHSPRLWYVSVNVVEAQVLESDNNRFPDAYVKVQIGNQVLKTKSVQSRTLNPVWNEDMMFVAAEPFEDHLILSVEDRVDSNKDETIGKVVIPLNSVEKRVDDRVVRTRWFNIEKSMSAALDGDSSNIDKFFSRLHLRVCLDGGYHVMDESIQYSSDLRPTAKQLWKPSIGVLELGIINANVLLPRNTRDGRGMSGTFCVAKYGHKWVRTRTIINSLCPKYNEQYSWEVHDPDTVLTVGVFHNSHIGDSSGNKDIEIGKVRIRVSALETNLVYTHSYPLLVLLPSGVKKLGELHLAIRFSHTSFVNMMLLYAQPRLPKMHYVRPLPEVKLDMLRHQAVNIVAAQLSRAEPPLRNEVVEYMSDVDSNLWSLRRSKANFFRLMLVFSALFAVIKWFREVCMWRNPTTTVIVHIMFFIVVCFPQLILPTVFICMFLTGLWNYRYRPRHPPHIDAGVSKTNELHPDELDEEFDKFPSTRSIELVRMRYDRLRSVAGRIQTVLGDVAIQGERIQALLSWRDPRATTIFVIYYLATAVVLYGTPFQVLAVLAGCFFMRHPMFRHKIPSAPINFFRRLPNKSDMIL